MRIKNLLWATVFVANALVTLAWLGFGFEDFGSGFMDEFHPPQDTADRSSSYALGQLSKIIVGGVIVAVSFVIAILNLADPGAFSRHDNTDYRKAFPAKDR